MTSVRFGYLPLKHHSTHLRHFDILFTRSSISPPPATTRTHQQTSQNPDGKLSNWLHIAMDKQLWEWHIYKLTHPNSPTPPRPNPSRPRRQQTRTTDEDPNSTRGDRNDNRNNQRRRNNGTRNQQHHQERSAPEPTQNHERTDYNMQNIGRTRIDSLRALGLGINATSTDIKQRFRTLSLIYHPDKYNESLGISKELATTHFQILNNAYGYLKETH